MNLKTNLRSGFSLVEMLVVIAVIGVIAAIAIPNIGGVNDAAKTARDQRNAQNIASIYAAGVAAGVVWDNGDVDKAVADVMGGKKPDDGAFAGKIFRCPMDGVPSGDLDRVKKHLSMSDDFMLIYKP